MTSETPRSVRDDMLHAAVGLLNEHGPDALQARKVASAAATSTMAVYTHFGGMRGLIAAVAEEGLRQFDAAQTVPQTDDPAADLSAVGAGYRRYAIEHPHMYRLMFGSTSAHGINAPAENVLTLTVAAIEERHRSFAHVVHAVRRCMLAGRITVGSADDDASVVAAAAQFWNVIHGFVMLELAGYYGEGGGPVLNSTSVNLLVALGDSPERAKQSLRPADLPPSARNPREPATPGGLRESTT